MIESPTDTAFPATVRIPAEAPWQRLSGRMILVTIGRLVLSLLPCIVMPILRDRPFTLSSHEFWPPVAITAVGILLTITSTVRYLRTHYRVTDDQVELKGGILIHRHRTVVRDRIRSVDSKARLRHRLTGLRVIVIGTGEAHPSFKIDAITRQAAADLRHRLLMSSDDAEVEAQAPEAPATVLARFRWAWTFYNMAEIWAAIVGALSVWSLYWALLPFGVNVLDIFSEAVGWDTLSTSVQVVVTGAALYLLGFLTLTTTFLVSNWRFELTRVTVEDGTALRTRRGLLQTREIYRADRRLKGVHISEPLLGRWMGLAESEVIATGLSGASIDGKLTSALLPRCSISDARRVSALVLEDRGRPLEAPLTDHPPGALLRRVRWALYLWAGGAVPLGAFIVSGRLPEWLYGVLAALLPVMLGLAVVSYTSLGHAVSGRFLIMRCGLARRSTTILERDAIIGWKFRQSIFQRRLGLMTIGVSTAAGKRFYHVPDLHLEQAIHLAFHTTPRLVAGFLEKGRRRDPK